MKGIWGAGNDLGANVQVYSLSKNLLSYRFSIHSPFCMCTIYVIYRIKKQDSSYLDYDLGTKIINMKYQNETEFSHPEFKIK